MTSKIKGLGLAFAILATMSGVAASGAQAGAIDLSGGAKATIKGHSETGQEHDFRIGTVVTVTCSTATFEGTLSQAINQEAQVTATYGKGPLDSETCKIAGLATHVRMNGCHYTITGQAIAFQAFVDIVGCTTGKLIEIEQTATKCIITIPEQNNLKELIFKQSGTTVTVEAKVTNITNTQDANCPEPNKEQQTASFTGNTILGAWEDTGQTIVTKHGHQYSQHNDNPLVEFQLTAT
jgi:hypothetical protein